LFNQPIPGLILLFEPHYKPVKDETGTHHGQNESYRGHEDRRSWAHLEVILSQMTRAKHQYSSLRHFSQAQGDENPGLFTHQGIPIKTCDWMNHSCPIPDQLPRTNPATHVRRHTQRCDRADEWPG
jgi:hypothetical protein